MTEGTFGPSPDSPTRAVVRPPDDARLRDTVEALAETGGPTVATILLYGSHVQASKPDRWSAYDFVLVTDSYSAFYRRLVEGGHHSRPAWLLTGLSYFLAPNIISFDMGRPDQPPAKCAVVTPRELHRSLRPHSPDHFIKGRVVQKVALVWSRSPEDEAMVLSALRGAREGIVRWVRPFLSGNFNLETFAEKMLRISYRAEIRPESPDRVVQVFESQKQTLLGVAEESLLAAESRGEVVRAGKSFAWARPPGRGVWLFYTAYFAISKSRAVARWFKYMITFDGWLDYIRRKIERRAGFEVEIEERERRWPLIFLWPKLFLVLKNVKKPSTPPKTEETRGSA